MTTTDDGPPVLSSLADGVLVLTLSRPSRRNMWTAEMEEGYLGALESAADDPDVRVIVLTGAGDSFCPGLDPQSLSASAAGSTYLPNRRPQTLATTIPKPIICAINGSVAGLGLVHAMFTDYRFCDSGVKLATNFGRLGLPAEEGIAWVLSRIVGPSKAMDLLLTGRVMTSEEAHSLGIVDRLTEPGSALREAMAYARALAEGSSPVSMAMIKSQVYADLGETLEQARIRARHLLTVAKLQPDYQEGVASLVERRPPRFDPPYRVNL